MTHPYRPAVTLLAALLFTLALTALATQPAQAQTYTVLYNFSGGADGAHPWAGLTMDSGGNLYGTTGGYLAEGNTSCLAAPFSVGDCGTVFKMTRGGSGWVLSTLYRFTGDLDGARPEAPLTIAPDGSLYGTTTAGGGRGCYGNGCGAVFKLTPSSDGTWTEDTIYRFTGGADGGSPGGGALVLDRAGNLYGTTFSGGSQNAGTVFKLTSSVDGWTETVIHSFGASGDGAYPWGGVIVGPAGSLYGTTLNGAPGGTIYQMTPSNGGWTETVIYSINDQYIYGLYAGVVLDRFGNLYGGTLFGRVVFRLSQFNGQWRFHGIAGLNQYDGGIWSSLTVSNAPFALYGATSGGAVFKMTAPTDQQFGYPYWPFTSLHTFASGQYGSSLILDNNGNLYGTTAFGGPANCYNGCGVVFEITP